MSYTATCEKGTGPKLTSEITSMEIKDSLHYRVLLKQNLEE